MKISRIVSTIAVLVVYLAIFTLLLSTTASAQSKQEIEVGAGPEVISPLIETTKDSRVLSISETTADEYDYVSHIFTVADVVFFSYEDGTEVALFDSSATLIWNNNGNPLNKGEHAHVTVSQGVYTAGGSEKFAMLTGDPISRYVVGYYSMDQNGYGASTELYTWVPQIYGHCSFIVFAYQDNTQVTVEDTDTGVDIATFTINKGEHWRIETLDRRWLHITANNPVSALTAYDQGYFVPSASGKWSGTEFYTYVSDIWNWAEDLTVIAYSDGTFVTIKDSDTGVVIWSGTLDSGQAHVESYPNGADKFFTIMSSKTVTVSVQPWVSVTNSYHQGAYVPDSTGTVLGTDIIGSTLDGGYLYILAYKDNTNVVVYNSQTGDLVNSYTLNAGDDVDANPGNGLWRIMSNYPVSAYSGWGNWNADFAPVEFREVTAVNVDISTDKDFYAATEDITISTKVTDADGNPLYPLEKENFKASVNENEVDIEEFERISCTDYRLEIKAPDTSGTHTITITATAANGQGSDSTKIKVFTIGNVHLTIEGNRLTQYQNSADTPIYYRGDSNVYPIFYVDVEVNGATFSEIKDNIQVFANISDYTKVKDSVNKQATYDSGVSKYKADWKNSPNDYPVGEYNITAEVKDSNDNLLASSEKQHFYLIFKTPTEYESFVTHHRTTSVVAGGWGVNRELHQYEEDIWRLTLDSITGKEEILEAIEAIANLSRTINGVSTFHHTQSDETFELSINEYDEDADGGADNADPDGPLDENWDHNYEPSTMIGSTGRAYRTDHPWYHPGWVDADGNFVTLWNAATVAWFGDSLDFQQSDFDPEDEIPHEHPVGVCDDYAMLTTAYLRSIGIPSRQVSGWARDWGHCWVQYRNNNRWNHLDTNHEIDITGWNQNKDEPGNYLSEGVIFKPPVGNILSPYFVKTRGNSPTSPLIDIYDEYTPLADITDITLDDGKWIYLPGDSVSYTVYVQGGGLQTTTFPRIKLDVTTVMTKLFGPPEIYYKKFDLGLPFTGTTTKSDSFELPISITNIPIIVAKTYLTIDKSHIMSLRTKIIPKCLTQNPVIGIDGAQPIEFPLINATAIDFNISSQESWAQYTFSNYSGIPFELKIKTLTNNNKNYSMTKWSLRNMNSIQHQYTLTMPIYGVDQNAVYIPNVGNVTSNITSINANVNYVIIYNSSEGTNGNVSIYTFSKNTTIKDVKFFNYENITMVNITCEQEYILPPNYYKESHIFSKNQNGDGLSFQEIYNNFASEIINNSDSLLEIDIKLEPNYRVGDVVNISATISNNGMQTESTTLQLNIHQLLVSIGAQNTLMYNATKNVTIQAGSNETVTFTYTTENMSLGPLGIIIEDITSHTKIKGEAQTVVDDGFNITVEYPPNVEENNPFSFNVSIHNIWDKPIHDIYLKLNCHHYFNSTQNLTKYINILNSEKTKDYSFLLNPIRSGSTTIDIEVYSSDGGHEKITKSINVPKLPELRLTLSSPQMVNKGDNFTLEVTVKNEGDLNLSGVSVNLSLPDNVTTTDDLTKLIGDLAGGATKSVNWTITSMRENDFWIEVNGCDVNDTYCAHATELINIVKPEIELDLVNPVEVILNQSFSAIAKIENIGEFNATQVKVNLSLPPEFETANDTFVNIGDLSQGQTKEVEWILKGVNPGYGEITVNVTLSGDVSITKGVIVTYFPLTVKTNNETYMEGEDVVITTALTNNNPKVSYVDLLVNITVQGPGIGETYSLPIDYISSLESRNFALTWNSTGKDFGNYIVTAKVLENSSVLSETSTSFTIWMCGDVNIDHTINVLDVLEIYRHALDPEYQLKLPWAADVNCDSNINVLDVLAVYRRALDPEYDLNCCCE